MNKWLLLIIILVIAGGAWLLLANLTTGGKLSLYKYSYSDTTTS